MQKKSVQFSNLSLEEMKIPVEIRNIKTYAIVGNEQFDINGEKDFIDGYIFTIQHPQYVNSHFNILMDEKETVTSINSPEWVTDEIISDVLTAIGLPKKIN